MIDRVTAVRLNQVAYEVRRPAGVRLGLVRLDRLLYFAAVRRPQASSAAESALSVVSDEANGIVVAVNFGAGISPRGLIDSLQ